MQYNLISYGAMKLLVFIYKTETSEMPPACYEVIYGHNQNRLKKKITDMTLAEIQKRQSDWTRRYGSSATGAAQFMKATLRDLMKELNLPGSIKLDASLQNQLAYHLLKRRGYEEFIAGKITVTEFGKRLAMEWASFPVLAATQGAHRRLKRGQSYYAGDALNKSLVQPAEVERVLKEVYRLENPVVQPEPLLQPKPEPIKAPKPMEIPKELEDTFNKSKTDKPVKSGKPERTTILALVIAALAAGLTSAWAFIQELACKADVFNWFCGG